MMALLLRIRRPEGVDEGVAGPEGDGWRDDLEEQRAPDDLDETGGGGGGGDGGSLGEAPPRAGGIIWEGAVALTVGIVALVWNLVKGAILIRWSDLSAIPEGEDTITLTDAGPGIAGSYMITLNVPTWMIWWKAVELYSRTGDLKAKADCWTDAGVAAELGKKTSSFTIPASEVPGGFLVFKKAKRFGVHTSMYVIKDEPFTEGAPLELSRMVGRNLVLNWAVAFGEGP